MIHEGARNDTVEGFLRVLVCAFSDDCIFIDLFFRISSKHQTIHRNDAG